MKTVEKRCPLVRFKGFRDDWEQRKLGDMCEDYIEKTTIQNQYPVLTSSQQSGIVLQNEYFANRQATTDENIGYYVLPRGYFTFRSRSDNDVFVFNRNDIIDKGIISYFYPVFRAMGVDSEFLLYRLNNGLKQQITMIAEGTGQHVLSLKKFKKIITSVPLTAEQYKIGDLFKNLDMLITFHQRKLAQLTAFKKAMLGKMFPQEGARVPEVRFSGFTDNWEQRKLGDLAEIGDIDHKMPQTVDDGIPYLMTGDFIGINELNFSEVKMISKADYERLANKIKPQKGDILFARYATVGAVRYVNFERDFLISYSCAIIKSSTKIVSKFLYQFLTSVLAQTQIKLEINTGSQANIGIDSMKNNIIVSMPTKDEQKKIGDFFFELDNLITIHQHKLTVLQQAKQSLLQKMFI